MTPRNTYRKTPAELAEQLRTEATLTDGVYRWKSNGQVPPLDLLEIAEVPLGILQTCRKASKADTEKFLADYRRNQRPPSDEELFEMRAAFGPSDARARNPVKAPAPTPTLRPA